MALPVAARKRAVAEAHRRELAKTELAAPAVTASAPSSAVLPYLLAAFALGLLILGLAMTPAWAVPWSRGSRILKHHRDELGVIGTLSLVTTVVLFVVLEGLR
jgi:hypothetical protein